MKTIYADVAAFHKGMGLPVLLHPRIPAKKEVDLRDRLIDEEWGETVDAIDNRDLVKVADGIGDTIYVVVGTALQYGVPLSSTALSTYPYSGIPSFPEQKTLDTRIDAINTHIDAFKSAVTAEDLNGIESSLSVTVSCLATMAQEFSFPLPAIWMIIQRTNMTKLNYPHKEDCKIEVTGRCTCGAVTYDAGGKIMKPANFVPADEYIKALLINCGASI